jgi:hypothetical protein
MAQSRITDINALTAWPAARVLFLMTGSVEPVPTETKSSLSAPVGQPIP